VSDVRVRNLLLLVVDCARTEKTLGFVPGGSAATGRSAPLPFLDDLRERGTTWTHYCSVSSTTTPNFATMFTGLTPREHGIVEHSRHALNDVTTLADVLRAHGWTTAAETTGPLVPECGLGRGFHHYRHRDRSEYLHGGFERRLGKLLAELPSPWFLCVHLWEAHAPYQNPPPFSDPHFGVGTYDRALAAVDAGLRRALGSLPAGTTVVLCGDHGERLDVDYELQAAIGGEEHRVLECFRRHAAAHTAGLDYGEWFRAARRELGEIPARIYAHNVLGHGFHLTEELIRVPLVVVDPERCAPGTERGEVRSQLDLFATLLDLAGVEAPPDRGTSLLAEGDGAPVYVEANGSGGKAFAARCTLRGVRSREWKYWRVEGASAPHEVLWNLGDDPRETRNVAEAHPAVVADLARRTTAWKGRRAAGEAPSLAPEEEKVLQETLRGLGYL
jgi:arylsulfatase A-like enzyme